MKNSKSMFLYLVTILFAIVAIAVSARAATYTVASVKGSFSFLINKSTADATAHQVAVLGVLDFDGAGKATASFSNVQGGVLLTGTGNGTYTVNANGSGTITMTTTLGTTIQFAFVLDATARGLAGGLHLLVTNETSNSVLSGMAVLQSTTAATYTLASLNGKFGFRVNDSTADVTQPQIGVMGLFSFNGTGKVSASFTQVKSGLLSTGTGTGTYTVNADGTGNINLVVGTDNPQIAFVLNTVTVNTAGLGQAKGLQLLQTNENGKNETDSGAALKQ